MKSYEEPNIDFISERMVLARCERCSSCTVCNSYRQQLLQAFKPSYRERENINIPTLTEEQKKTKIFRPSRHHQLDATLISQVHPLTFPVWQPDNNRLSQQLQSRNTVVSIQSSTTITHPASFHSPSELNVNNTVGARQSYEGLATTSSGVHQHSSSNSKQLAKERLNSISDSFHRFGENLRDYEDLRKNNMRDILQNKDPLYQFKSCTDSKLQEKVEFSVRDLVKDLGEELLEVERLHENGNSSLMLFENPDKEVSKELSIDSDLEKLKHSSNQHNDDGKIVRNNNNGEIANVKFSKTTTKLYKFLIDQLENKDPCMMWIERSEGMFRITVPERLAKLWGDFKGNPSMTYGNLARSFRHYYKTGKLENTTLASKCGKKKLYYKFSKQILKKHDIIS